MTIQRGKPWGVAVQSPAGLPLAPSDAAARDLLLVRRSDGRPLPAIGLAGGDLARTMGGGAPGRFPGVVTEAPVDLLRVEVDGRTTWALAHVVARRQWWRGEVLFAMNAQFLGRFDVAPRSHPNDGKVDVLRVAARMPLRARLQARRRARTGTHLPHPQLVALQARQHTAEFARPLHVRVDGVRWCTARSLTITVEPDAVTVFA